MARRSSFLHCRDERWRRPLYGVIAAAGLLSNVHCAWQMNRFEREEVAHFDLLLRNLPRGKRLLMLTFRNGSHIANAGAIVT